MIEIEQSTGNVYTDLGIADSALEPYSSRYKYLRDRKNTEN